MARAEAPRTLPIQARLTTPDGQPVNGARTITFTLYAADGQSLWSSGPETVAVNGGVFSTTLGDDSTAWAALTWQEPYSVGIRVGSDPEMVPRLTLAAVPYAHFAVAAGAVPPHSITSEQLAVDEKSLAAVSNGKLTATSFPDRLLVGNTATDVWFTGRSHVAGANYMEFGAGVIGKEANAGKIGYQTLTPGMLDIVGAGTTADSRQVKVWGELHAAANGPVLSLEGNDHAYIEYYPGGTRAGRKAFVGFPGAGSRDFVIENQNEDVLGHVSEIYMAPGAVGVNKVPRWTFDVNGVAHADGFSDSSDIRYKRDVRTLPDALDTVMRLRGVSFRWRRDAFPQEDFPAGPQVGFVAQEVEPVLPQIVHTDAEGYKSVEYDHVVPVLVEAVKEQQREISERDARLAAEDARIAALDRRLNRLEQRSGAPSS
jgi:hypothetical protein